MKVTEKREKVGLKLNIHKTKIMASGPITSCQIDGETMETVRDFNFGDFFLLFSVVLGVMLGCLFDVFLVSWEIDGETVETVSDFIFGGSKITADGDCSHEI